MAGDWIKMRADLHTHPKVVRIASALKADRLRVIGGLHAVWCLFDVHSEDGSLSGYTTKAVDELIGFEGFAGAMCAVRWLETYADGIALPEFDEHNGQSAKRRAMETQRKRREREEEALEVVRKPSASTADKKRTREEKRREDKEEAQAPSALPDWLPLEAWAGYLEMRKKIRKVPTARAVKLVVKSLSAMHEKGIDVSQVLDNSTRQNWTDVYEPKTGQAAASDRIGSFV